MMRRKVHPALMEETEKVILEPLKVNCKLKASNVDVCYHLVFSDFDARYKSYCSNIARTFLIDTDPIQSKSYEILLKAHEAVIGSLKPGNKLGTAYLAAVSIVDKDAPHMVSCLTKSVGTRIVIEFGESGLDINAKNDRIVKEGACPSSSSRMLRCKAVAEETFFRELPKATIFKPAAMIVDEESMKIGRWSFDNEGMENLRDLEDEVFRHRNLKNFFSDCILKLY
ncbi:unnamed protein product [Vicia faba]|uniref:FACT complex subunit n=1 Tax=Vicia faba TaxID=3906 RepID=A0AAV0YUR2_VICFA|nr:unnamed protein product [Vicia faba]